MIKMIEEHILNKKYPGDLHSNLCLKVSDLNFSRLETKLVHHNLNRDVKNYENLQILTVLGALTVH